MKQKLERVFLWVHEKMTLFLLVFVYLLGVGATSIFLKIFRHPMVRSPQFASSSWVDVSKETEDMSDHSRQF